MLKAAREERTASHTPRSPPESLRQLAAARRKVSGGGVARGQGGGGRSMEEVTAGVVVVARPGGGGNGAAAGDDDRGQLVVGDGRLLEAERELKTKGRTMMSSAVNIILLLTWVSFRPPAWLLAARETGGEQQLRARLYRILHAFGMGIAAAVVMNLWLYRAGATLAGRPMAADRTLSTVRLALAAVNASVLAIFCLHASDCWRETAMVLFVTLASAAFTWLYMFGKLKGFFIKVPKVFGAK